MQDSALHEILTVLWLWIKGQFVIWVSVTALYLVGFGIARTPLWPVLAILCGIVSVIPHLGSLLGLLLVVVFSFVGSDFNLQVAALALGIWVLVQIIEIFFIGPRILGRKLGLNPWLLFLGGIAGAILAGPIGIIIATPILAVAAVLWRRRRTRLSFPPPLPK